MHEGAPRLSPDGKRVAFVSTVDPSAGYKIEVMNVDGTGRKVVEQVRNVSWPTWSPDGTQLLYVIGYYPMLYTLASGAREPLLPDTQSVNAHEGFDWAPLPGSVTPPAAPEAQATSRIQASSVGGIRALALPDPSTRAGSGVPTLTLWPYRDRYRDTLRINLRMNEPAKSRWMSTTAVASA